MKSVGKVQEFLSNLKVRHPNIKLAVEYSQSLAFLRL